MVAVCKLNNEEVIFWLVCFGCFFFNESQYWKSGKSLQRTPLREDTGTLNRDCMSEVLFLPFISLSYLSSKNDGDNWWQKKPQSNKNTLNPVTWEALWVRFLNFLFIFFLKLLAWSTFGISFISCFHLFCLSPSACALLSSPFLCSLHGISPLLYPILDLSSIWFFCLVAFFFCSFRYTSWLSCSSSSEVSPQDNSLSSFFLS